MTLIEEIKDLINRVENGNSVEEVQEVAEEPEQVETADEKEDIEEAFTEALAEVILEQ